MPLITVFGVAQNQMLRENKPIQANEDGNLTKTNAPILLFCQKQEYPQNVF